MHALMLVVRYLLRSICDPDSVCCKRQISRSSRFGLSISEKPGLTNKLGDLLWQWWSDPRLAVPFVPCSTANTGGRGSLLVNAPPNVFPLVAGRSLFSCCARLSREAATDRRHRAR